MNCTNGNKVACVVSTLPTSFFTNHAQEVESPEQYDSLKYSCLTSLCQGKRESGPKAEHFGRRPEVC